MWDTLEHNQGNIEVQSDLDIGTRMYLTFLRIAPEKWMAQEIYLTVENQIVILDDDESIHTAWNLRFTSLPGAPPLHHFTQGQEALNFLATLSLEQKNQMVFLSDYELRHQSKNGLQIIEASGIKNAILVTSYFSSQKIQDEAERLGIKVLPKQMAIAVPVYVDTAT